MLLHTVSRALMPACVYSLPKRSNSCLVLINVVPLMVGVASCCDSCGLLSWQNNPPPCCCDVCVDFGCVRLTRAQQTTERTEVIYGQRWLLRVFVVVYSAAQRRCRSSWGDRAGGSCNDDDSRNSELLRRM